MLLDRKPERVLVKERLLFQTTLLKMPTTRFGSYFSVRSGDDQLVAKLSLLAFQKLLIYYCTICALYPSLYTSQLPSSADSLNSDNEREAEPDHDQRRDQSLTSMANSLTSELKPAKRNAFQTSFSTNELSFDFMAHANLETTSEGLCDHVREIFSINRQVFSEYQIKAMKKLLAKKSHAQVSEAAYFEPTQLASAL